MRNARSTMAPCLTGRRPLAHGLLRKFWMASCGQPGYDGQPERITDIVVIGREQK